MSDARVAAWIGAWDRLAGVQKLVERFLKDSKLVKLPESYWAVLAEARILALMAQAPETVGLLAGVVLEDRSREKSERAERHSETFDEFMDSAERPDE